MSFTALLLHDVCMWPMAAAQHVRKWLGQEYPPSRVQPQIPKMPTQLCTAQNTVVLRPIINVQQRLRHTHKSPLTWQNALHLDPILRNAVCVRSRERATASPRRCKTTPAYSSLSSRYAMRVVTAALRAPRTATPMSLFLFAESLLPATQQSHQPTTMKATHEGPIKRSAVKQAADVQCTRYASCLCVVHRPMLIHVNGCTWDGCQFTRDVHGTGTIVRDAVHVLQWSLQRMTSACCGDCNLHSRSMSCTAISTAGHRHSDPGGRGLVACRKRGAMGREMPRGALPSAVSAQPDTTAEAAAVILAERRWVTRSARPASST